MTQAGPMRIALLSAAWAPEPHGGAEVTARLVAEGLAARGHALDVVTIGRGRRLEESREGALRVLRLPNANVMHPADAGAGALRRALFQLVDAYNPVMGARLRGVLARLRPDVVQAHNIRGFSAAAWRAADGLGIPLVQVLHDYWTVCPRSTLWKPGRGACARPCAECRVVAAPRRALSHLPAAYAAVSHRMLDHLVAAGLRPRATPRVIRNPNPAPVAAILPAGPRGGPLRLGFLGRLSPDKGLEVLLDALSRLPAGAASLAVAGSGEEAYLRLLRARAEGLPVRFLGHVPPAELLAAADLLVVPSVWEEPAGRVMHEAFLHGIPSVVFPRGGMPEIVRDGATGFVCAAADAPALAALLARLATQGWDREAMAARCRAAARAHALPAILDETEALLRAAARRTPPEGGQAWRAPACPPPERRAA